MKNRKTLAALSLGLVLVLIVASCSWFQSEPVIAPAPEALATLAPGMGSEGIGRFDRLQVEDSTANPIIHTNQAGSGYNLRMEDSSTLVLSVTDGGAMLIDGNEDAIQLTVQGYTTQTNGIFVVEATGGSDLFWVDGNGDVEMNGTTPMLTIGDAGEEDAGVVFDGAAQDFYIGLDDNVDDLVVGKGSALGTTLAFAIDENQVTTWSGGTLELTEDTTATNVLTAAECGKTIWLNSATEFATTLPAISTVSAGCAFRFIVKAAPAGASYTVITGNSLENVLIGGINELEVDTGDDGEYQAAGDTITFVNGVSVVGDFVYMISDGTSFYLYGQANADGGVTLTQAD